MYKWAWNSLNMGHLPNCKQLVKKKKCWNTLWHHPVIHSDNHSDKKHNINTSPNPWQCWRYNYAVKYFTNFWQSITFSMISSLPSTVEALSFMNVSCCRHTILSCVLKDCGCSPQKSNKIRCLQKSKIWKEKTDIIIQNYYMCSSNSHCMMHIAKVQ